jgi:hypothetical protein
VEPCAHELAKPSWHLDPYANPLATQYRLKPGEMNSLTIDMHHMHIAHNAVTAESICKPWSCLDSAAPQRLAAMARCERFMCFDSTCVVTMQHCSMSCACRVMVTAVRHAVHGYACLLITLCLTDVWVLHQDTSKTARGQPPCVDQSTEALHVTLRSQAVTQHSKQHNCSSGSKFCKSMTKQAYVRAQVKVQLYALSVTKCQARSRI